MPISHTDHLFRLIKSLTKAEKRNFKLYAKRIQSTDSLKFIQLFDYLDKQNELKENLMLEKFSGVSKNQMSNLKRHLYSQILISLRLIHIQKSASIQIREQIDFANILYGKGLHIPSLKILERARKMAVKNGLEILTLSILEIQKLIESRHITRTGTLKNVELADIAEKKVRDLTSTILLSNLRLKVHGYYIRNGHIKSREEFVEVQEMFENQMPGFKFEELGFYGKIYLYQSFVWYYHIIIDFIGCFEYSLKWIQVFNSNPNFISWDPDLYMRGYHYLLTSAYNLRDIQNFNLYQDELEHFRKSNYSKFKMNSKIISFLYVHTSRLNKHFLVGSFEEGSQIIPRTTRRLRMYHKKIDPHYTLVFYFKIAWMYLCNEQPSKSIDFLNKIIYMNVENLREDIQGYSRLMLLMAHYDLSNYNIMEYVVRTVKAFYVKMNVTNQVQENALDFFHNISSLPLNEHKIAFRELLLKLDALYNDPIDHRAFLYLDIYSWVQSKLQRKPMSQIIREQNIRRL